MKRIKIGLFVLVSFCGATYADNLEIKLGSGDVFEVQDSSGTSLMDVLSSGNVGIGTMSPVDKLDVAGGITSSSASGGSLGALNPNNQSAGVSLSWLNDVARIRVGGSGQGAGNGLDIQRFGDVSIMRLLENGNVGIGTTNPGTKLDVAGDNATLRLSETAGGGQEDIIGTIEFDEVYYGGGVIAKIQGVRDPDRDDGRIEFLTTLNGSQSEKMRIDSSGNVGIGTMTPAGKLDVNGTIYQRGGQLHADYVFESDYALESIREHADFMWRNKHLKAIPKAKVDSDGQEIVEVGSHRKGIVEELEKAHIYIEQLYAKNKKLENRLTKLESLVNRGQ